MAEQIHGIIGLLNSILIGSSRNWPKSSTIYNIIRWFAGLLERMTRQPSIWCSKYFFSHKILQNSLQKPFQFIFSHLSIRYYEKEILGTSDTWLTSLLSHQPSEPAYYTVDCRIYVPLCVDNAIEVSASYYNVQCISTSFQLHKYTCFIKLWARRLSGEINLLPT